MVMVMATKLLVWEVEMVSYPWNSNNLEPKLLVNQTTSGRNRS